MSHSSSSSGPVIKGDKRVSQSTGDADHKQRDVEFNENWGEPQFDWSKPWTSCLCGCFNYVLQLILVGTCGAFLYGLNMGLMNTCMKYIAWDLDWCPNHAVDGAVNCTAYTNYSAFLSTAVFLGAAIGALGGGGLVARGRRMIYLFSMLILAFGIIACTVANSYSALIYARLVVGLGVGIVSFSCPLYMSELTPKEVRGKYGVFYQLFITIGILVSALIGLPMALVQDVPTDGSDYVSIDTFNQVWWRVMLGIGILPVILCSYLLTFCFPFETPHYYITVGRYADAAALFRRLYNREDVVEPMKDAVQEIELAKEAEKNGLSLSTAMHVPEYRYVIILGCVLSAFQQLTGINVFIASSNALFADAGLTGSGPTIATIGMDLVNFVMTIPAVYLIESMGRKSLMFMGTVGQAIGTLPAALMYWISPDSDATMYVAIVSAILFIISFAVAYGPALWVFLFEMYPSSIKGPASGAATAVNWICCFIMVFVTNYLSNQVSYTIFCVLSFVAAAIVFFCMKETRGLPLGVTPYITTPIVI